jgi:hypothetical protein
MTGWLMNDELERMWEGLVVGIVVIFAWRDCRKWQKPSQDSWFPWFSKYEPGLFTFSVMTFSKLLVKHHCYLSYFAQPCSNICYTVTVNVCAWKACALLYIYFHLMVQAYHMLSNIYGALCALPQFWPKNCHDLRIKYIGFSFFILLCPVYLILLQVWCFPWPSAFQMITH